MECSILIRMVRCKYFMLFGSISLIFPHVKSWLILVLLEMIRVSLVIVCPIVFLLLCDLGHHGGMLKLMKNGQI